MNTSALTIDELLRYEGDSRIEKEIVRRFRGEELFTRSQVDEIEDRAGEQGYADAIPQAIEFLCGIMDGEVWKEQLDEDRRDWVKTDLLMLLDHPTLET